MKAQLLVVGVLSLSLAFTASALTSGRDEDDGAAVRVRQEAQVTETESEDGQEMGEREQMRVREESEDAEEEGREDDMTGDGVTGTDREDESTGTRREISGFENAERRRSEVANAVREMLQVADREGGIGEQIRAIAQNQTRNREDLEESLRKIQGRSGFVRFFLGPDFGAIEEAWGLLERNREEIRQLEQMKGELTDAADLQMIEDQIALLGEADSSIDDSLAEARKGFSLLGWAFRLFAK